MCTDEIRPHVIYPLCHILHPIPNSLCCPNFPCVVPKFPVFSLSGKSDNQIPCFPCAVATLNMIGLSQERPILDHHAKAHIHEIHPKPYKIRCFNKNSSVWGVLGGGYDPGSHEIQGHSPSPAFIKLNSFG